MDNLNEKIDSTQRALYEVAKEQGMSPASAAKASNLAYKSVQKAQGEISKELKGGMATGNVNRIK